MTGKSTPLRASRRATSARHRRSGAQQCNVFLPPRAAGHRRVNKATYPAPAGPKIEAVRGVLRSIIARKLSTLPSAYVMVSQPTRELRPAGRYMTCIIAMRRQKTAASRGQRRSLPAVAAAGFLSPQLPAYPGALRGSARRSRSSLAFACTPTSLASTSGAYRFHTFSSRGHWRSPTFLLGLFGCHPYGNRAFA